MGGRPGPGSRCIATRGRIRGPPAACARPALPGPQPSLPPAPPRAAPRRRGWGRRTCRAACGLCFAHAPHFLTLSDRARSPWLAPHARASAHGAPAPCPVYAALSSHVTDMLRRAALLSGVCPVRCIDGSAQLLEEAWKAGRQADSWRQGKPGAVRPAGKKCGLREAGKRRVLQCAHAAADQQHRGLEGHRPSICRAVAAATGARRALDPNTAESQQKQGAHDAGEWAQYRTPHQSCV